MTNPSVACVLLANGRHEMVARAVRSFAAQTYDNRLLLVWDTGHDPLNIRADKTVYCPVFSPRERSIGELRNDAIGLATNADIIVTMDSDDWSGPRRIEEQVALLVASGAEAVGYKEVLFSDERPDILALSDGPKAWLYFNPAPNYAIGASLAFWRSTWARRPFPHLPVPGNRQSAGEDAEWLRGVKCLGVSSLKWKQIIPQMSPLFEMVTQLEPYDEPRLICSIHGGNSQAYELALPSPYFRRAAQFDDFCRKEMAL